LAVGNFSIKENNESYSNGQKEQKDAGRWEKFVNAVKEFEASWSKHEKSAANKVGKVQK
jgi:hypothetical protein